MEQRAKYANINTKHIMQYSKTSIILTSIIQTLNYLNSSADCSSRIFCQQVYVLLEYFIKGVYSIRVV